MWMKVESVSRGRIVTDKGVFRDSDHPVRVGDLIDANGSTGSLVVYSVKPGKRASKPRGAAGGTRYGYNASAAPKRKTTRRSGGGWGGR